MKITASMLVQLLRDGKLDVGGTTLTLLSDLEKRITDISEDMLKSSNYKDMVIKMMVDLDNFKGTHYGNEL